MKKRNTTYDIIFQKTKVFDKYVDVFETIDNRLKRFIYRVIFFFQIGAGLSKQYKYKYIIYNTKTKQFYTEFKKT